VSRASDAAIALNSPEAWAREQALEVELARITHERAAWDAQRAAELGARNEVDERQRREAAERVEAARRAIAAKLARDVHATLAPLWAAFREEPNRASVRAICAAWRTLAQRAQQELGDALGEHLLATTLLATFDGAQQNRAARVAARIDYSALSCGEQAYALKKAIEAEAADTAVIFDAARALESQCARLVANAADIPDPLGVRRAAAFGASPTNRDAVAAVAAVETDWAAEQQAARVAENDLRIAELAAREPRVKRGRAFFGV
jgi:hypothetical protein